MAELLYRLGIACSRHAWRVVGAWLLILVAAGTAFVLGRGPLATGFDIPGTETARVSEVLRQKLPALSGGSGLVVFHTRDGSPLSAAQREAISTLAAGAKGLPYVAAVNDPFAAEATRQAQAQQLEQGRAQLGAAELAIPAGSAYDAAREKLALQRKQLELGEQLMGLAREIRVVSADGSTAVVTIAFSTTRLELPDAAKTSLTSHFRQQPVDGVDTEISAEIAQTVPQIVGPAEAAGVAIAALVLVVMLGTLIAAGLPIVTALAGLAVGILATLSLSGAVRIASVTPVLGVMLGLAVGIDYALFILNRHRRQLAEGMELHESIGIANGTAGNAVVFAGSTVLVALLGLNLTGIPFLGLMGTVGAVCVAVAVLVAVTLTPALLALIGQRVVSRRLRRNASRAVERPATPMPTWRALASVLLGATALLVIAIPALSLRLGLPDGSAEAQDTTQYRAHKLVEAELGKGANGPLLVTATLTAPAGSGLPAEQARIAQVIAQRPHVAGVAPIAASQDQTYLAFQVLPSDGPTSQATEDLVRDLRSLSPLPGGTVLGVAGQATGNIDLSAKLAEALPTYLAVVIGLSALIMLVVFRSLLVPVIATTGFVLSLFATYGALAAVYQWGWLDEVFGVHDPGPLLNFLPIVLVGILFGLAMDYQLFLASGMREAYVHGTPARAAVTAGLRAGRAVVTAAGIIMIAVFSGFIFSETVVVRPLGFGLAFGVLADAFVVRMLVVPGLLHLLGPAAWWLPRRLGRLIPNIDIEGAALRHKHGHE